MRIFTAAQDSSESASVPVSFFRMTGSRFFAAVNLASLLFLAVSLCQAKSFHEEQVKAVFLYNLTKFIEWPAGKAIKSDAFVLGVLGRKPFDNHLEKVVDGELVGGKKIIIQQYLYTDSIEWEKINLLFVSHHYVSEINELVQQSRKYEVLMVGDSQGFCENGGGVNLLVQDRHIKIEVNLDEVRKSGISISAQVLKLARIVSSSQAVPQ